MKNEFVPYDIALAMTQVGWGWHEGVMGWYCNTTQELRRDDNLPVGVIYAPLYQQAFKWFREEYRLDGKPEYFLNDWYCYIINDMKGEDNSRKLFTEFPTYEEAQDACLRKLIEIVKEK